MYHVSPYPMKEDILCTYAAYLADQGLRHQTIKCYLSAIRHQQKSLGFPDPNISTMPCFEQLLRGIKVVRGKQDQSANPCLPITPAILKQAWLSNRLNSFDGRMLWAAASLCFFGFFKVGELTMQSETSFDLSANLSFADVAVDDCKNPTLLQIHLKASKTDPFRSGVNVFVGESGNELCPIRAMTEYLSQRGGQSGPLFCFRNGRYLTRSRFVDQVREALRQAGVDASKFAGHSFRRGAATTALEKGISDATIKMLGRWRSEAYTRYIRTPCSQLAAYTRMLGETRGTLN